MKELLIDEERATTMPPGRTAVTVFRIALSCFALVLIVIAIAGWFWTTRHQAPLQALASHVVLAASALAACGGLRAVWKRPSDLERTRD